MSLGALLFLVAFLVTVLVAVPVALASIMQREGPAASWLRGHARWFRFAAALAWSTSLSLKLLHGASFAQLDVAASGVGFVCAVAAAFLHQRRASESAPHRNERAV